MDCPRGRSHFIALPYLHLQESRTLFHVIGLKCQHCGSYNTCRTAEPDPHPTSENATGGAGDDGARGGEESSAVPPGEEGTTSGRRVVTHPSDHVVRGRHTRLIHNSKSYKPYIQ